MTHIRLRVDEIQRARKAAHKESIAEFADFAGLGRATIHRACRGDGFNSATLSALVGAGCRIGHLIEVEP